MSTIPGSLSKPVPVASPLGSVNLGHAASLNASPTFAAQGDDTFSRTTPIRFGVEEWESKDAREAKGHADMLADMAAKVKDPEVAAEMNAEVTRLRDQQAAHEASGNYGRDYTPGG